MTEQAALQQLQKGKDEALSWFVETYNDYVGTVIYNTLGGALTQEELEELAAQTFYALWEVAEELRPQTVRGFLGSTARRLARERFRSQGKALPRDEELLPDPGGRRDQQALSQQVRRAVLLMPFPDREIFLRYYYYVQPVEQIAQALAMPETEISAGLRRCRGKLWDALSGQEASPWN